MAKKTRDRAARTDAAGPAGDNPRRPCPCGSGKRYKACHGAGDDVIVLRPFEGLAAEPDLVAMREFLPSALAPLPLLDAGSAAAEVATEVTVATVLPGASAAVVRPDGAILVAMQVQTRSGDLSADLARALRWAQQAEPGTALPVVGPNLGDDGVVRLQDQLRPDVGLEVTMHQDFAWWVPRGPDGAEPAPDVTAAIERANAVIMPTERIAADGVRAAYWVNTGSKTHLRWVRPEPEDQLLAALARLAAADQLALGDGTRFAGIFRAHGLLVPVWDLDSDRHAKEWADPVASAAGRLTEALADDTPLTDAQRRSRDALAGKQVTLR